MLLYVFFIKVYIFTHMRGRWGVDTGGHSEYTIGGGGECRGGN